jgi:hypothetical protein
MDCLGKADPDEPTLICGYWHVGPHRSLYVVATEVLGAMGYRMGPTGELYKRARSAGDSGGHQGLPRDTMVVAKLKGARERKRLRTGQKVEGRRSHAELYPELVALVASFVAGVLKVVNDHCDRFQQSLRSAGS